MTSPHSLKYELKRQREKIGDVELEIESLKDLNQTIDDLFIELEKTGNTALLEELCPYFGTVWPSARALAQAIHERRAEFEGKRVLELGCGLAVPGLLAAKLGAHVIATDFHPEVPRFLERNLLLNAIDRLEYKRIDWAAEFPALGGFDWIIGSDVLYEREHAIRLSEVTAHFMKPGVRALIADPARPYLQAFVDEMTRHGFNHRTKVRTAPDDPKPKDVFIVEFATENLK